MRNAFKFSVMGAVLAAGFSVTNVHAQMLSDLIRATGPNGNEKIEFFLLDETRKNAQGLPVYDLKSPEDLQAAQNNEASESEAAAAAR